MKWAVNMRTKTLTICLSPSEVMELYVARDAGVRELGGEGESIWREGVGKIVGEAAEAMFPLAFPSASRNVNGPLLKVEKVAWDEVCGES